MKSEIGEVIAVVKGASAYYQVRLKRGEIVSVDHQLIMPKRVTLLPKGTPLLVTHELGIVQSASTELSPARQGVIVAILKHEQKSRHRGVAGESQNDQPDSRQRFYRQGLDGPRS